MSKLHSRPDTGNEGLPGQSRFRGISMRNLVAAAAFLAASGSGVQARPRETRPAFPLDRIARELGVPREAVRVAFDRVRPADSLLPDSPKLRESDRIGLSVALGVTPERLEEVMSGCTDADFLGEAAAI